MRRIGHIIVNIILIGAIIFFTVAIEETGRTFIIQTWFTPDD